MKETEKQEETANNGQATILLIDDEKLIVEVSLQMLAHLGFNTVVARSGEEAIRLFKTDHMRIDLVILDIIMPGMDGGEVLERLKEINPRSMCYSPVDTQWMVRRPKSWNAVAVVSFKNHSIYGNFQKKYPRSW